MSLPSAVLLRTQSDERLVALAQEGHERAFEAIVERYRRPLLRACRRVLPEARAEDALQHALLAAWAALQRRDEVRDLRAWLFRIAHNTALNQLRVNGYDHDELHELLRGGAGPEEEAERRMVVRATLAGLAALPERQRDALLQIAVQGRGQEAVARDLGLSEGAVRQLVHRARVQLRAAATAVTPMPLAAWLASAAPRAAAVADRVGEIGAGGGLAGAAAKVGAVAVLAGGVATPAIVHVARDGAKGAAAADARPGGLRGGHGAGSGGAGVTSSGVVRLVDDRHGASGPGSGDDRDRRGGGPGSGDDRSGSSRRGERHNSSDDGRAGSGRRSGSSGGSGSRRDDGSGDDRSGSSGDDRADDRSGPSVDDRSGSSGDDRSGSSGAGGSGTSGDDSSGSSGDDRSGSSGSASSGGGSSSSGPGSGGSLLSSSSGGDDGITDGVLTTSGGSSGSGSSGRDGGSSGSGSSGSGSGTSGGGDDALVPTTTSSSGRGTGDGSSGTN